MKIILPLICLLYLSSGQALTLNGFTGFASSFKLNGRVNGLVHSVDVKTGQRVKKGDILIQLDVTPHQAKLDQAIALENSLLPVMQTAQLELERAEELYDRDSLSQVALKNAQNVFAEAEGNYLAAKAEKVFAEYQLSNTVIKSPVNGQVLSVDTNIGEYINPEVSDAALITVVDSFQMEAVALIKSEQWDSTLVGKKASIKFANKEFTGKVSYLSYQRTEQSGVLPAYEIHISFRTNQLIPAEMPVSIDIKE